MVRDDDRGEGSSIRRRRLQHLSSLAILCRGDVAAAAWTASEKWRACSADACARCPLLHLEGAIGRDRQTTADEHARGPHGHPSP
jgi:hypothetical protein